MCIVCGMADGKLAPLCIATFKIVAYKNGIGDVRQKSFFPCCKTPYKIHRTAPGIVQLFVPLPKACVKHCCFSRRLGANETFYFSYMYFLAFTGLRRECKSQHTKCVSFFPKWFLK